MQHLILIIKENLSKTAVAVGGPTTGGLIGIASFFEKITPILTVTSILTGIILGILSYRLKVKKIKQEKKNGQD